MQTTPSETYFNPPALWGAGPRGAPPGSRRGNFNPPALWGAGQPRPRQDPQCPLISIHPPCGGRDLTDSLYPITTQLISIHPPCGGRDHSGQDIIFSQRNFNPPALWGAGHTENQGFRILRNFNPPALWGAGLAGNHVRPVAFYDFNPPALWGAGPCSFSSSGSIAGFQSTRPVGGGTANALVFFVAEIFQSTRPVGGGTSSSIVLSPDYLYFNPPALWGAGLCARCTK